MRGRGIMIMIMLVEKKDTYMMRRMEKISVSMIRDQQQTSFGDIHKP
jgi:hypothetical protein